MRGLLPRPVRSRIQQSRYHERAEYDPAHPRKRQHRGQEATCLELRAEFGQVGPYVLQVALSCQPLALRGCDSYRWIGTYGSDGGADEPHDPEDEEPEELMPDLREVPILTTSVDHVRPVRYISISYKHTSCNVQI